MNDGSTFCADCGVEQDDDTVLTPVVVERAITKALRDLRHGVGEIRAARERANEAKREFTVFQAKERKRIRARFREEGRSKYLEKEVDEELTVTDEWKDAAVAHDLVMSALDDARDFQKMLENRLDGLRTLSSSLRSQT